VFNLSGTIGYFQAKVFALFRAWRVIFSGTIGDFPA
jgi:hypothetical protein